MTIIEVKKLLEEHLKTGNGNSDDLLYKVNIEADPYADLSRRVPFVLIEADNSTAETSATGFPVRQTHKLSVTCVDSTHNKKYYEYKERAVQLAVNTVNKIMQLTDDRIRVFTRELAYDEIMLGSLKATAVIIEVEVETYWDN